MVPILRPYFLLPVEWAWSVCHDHAPDVAINVDLDIEYQPVAAPGVSLF